MLHVLPIAVLVILSLVIVSMLVAGAEARISDFLGQGCLTTLRYMNETERELGRADGWLRERIKSALAAMGEDGIWVGWRIVGSWLYLGVSAAACIGDAGLLLLTFNAMGITSGNPPRLGASVEVLSALAYLGSATIFGLLLLDCCGRTHFGPWPHEGNGVQRKSFLSIAVLGLAASALVGGFAGLWRGLQVTEIDTGSDAALLLISSVIPVLLVVAVALGSWAFAWAITSVWVTALSLGVLGLSLARAPLRILAATCEVGFGFVASGIALAAAPGRAVYSWLCSFEGLRTALHLPPMPLPSQTESNGGRSAPDNARTSIEQIPASHRGGNGARELGGEGSSPEEELVVAGVGGAEAGPHGRNGHDNDDDANYDPFNNWGTWP